MEIDTRNQYAFVDFENASKKWVLTLLNKGIVVDEKGIILEGFGNFYSPNFNSILEEKQPLMESEKSYCTDVNTGVLSKLHKDISRYRIWL